MFEIKFREFNVFKDRVKNKWITFAPELWWGDRLDSRFIALYYLKNIRNKKVIDVGCNIGVVLSELDLSNFLVGIDISDRALRIAKALNNDSALFLKADMLHLPIKRNSFDLVIFLGMVEVPEWKEKIICLSQISDILKKDGELVITTPNSSYLSLDKKEKYVDYDMIKSFLKHDYSFRIFGFNPFPGFPYFLPNRILVKIPFIWKILFFMMKGKLFLRYCRSFFVVAKKK